MKHVLTEEEYSEITAGTEFKISWYFGRRNKMTQFLIEHFVKDYEDVEKISVRTAYGVLASIVGIFCNVFCLQ